MKNTRFWLVLAGVLLLIPSSMAAPSPSYACSPPPLPDLQTVQGKAEVIFMGKVVEVDNSPFATIDEAMSFSGRKRVLFTVTSIWKGPLTTQAVVSVANTVCGYSIHDFYKDEGFLVFARSGALGGLDAFSARELERVTAYMRDLGEGTAPTEQVALGTLFFFQSYWTEAALGTLLIVATLRGVRAIRKFK